ncbi:MAG TPA: hypothetical protein VFG37_00200 [Planctomycetota bacterium]|nr:hypothetical protein [Planctomycetota bacterium]
MKCGTGRAGGVAGFVVELAAEGDSGFVGDSREQPTASGNATMARALVRMDIDAAPARWDRARRTERTRREAETEDITGADQCSISDDKKFSMARSERR